MREAVDTILRYLDHEDEEILSLRNTILELDGSRTDELENVIEQLHDTIKQYNLENQDYIAYYLFFSDCIYYEKREYSLVTKSLQKTIPLFWEQINKALANWLLGISYSNINEYPKARAALKEALTLLNTNRQINTLSEQKKYDERLPIREQITEALKNIPTSKPNISERKKEKPNNVQFNSVPKLTGSSLVSKNKQSPDSSSKASAENNSNIRHIIVPVDISAFSNKQINATPLNHELFDKLEIYNNPETFSQKNISNLQEVSAKKHIIIPKFSIYGYVSAGPNGEALLSSSEVLGQSSEVDENMKVKIEEQEYEIKFISSPAPTFLKSRVYGWLKVTGESMNMASPYPILPNDYLLFYENKNFESCIRKIVIAQISEMEGYPPRTIVKRLIKMSGETPHQEDGYACELHKFMLHSESSLERDTVTGVCFKKDIEIEHEYQIIGEVVVIAKLV